MSATSRSFEKSAASGIPGEVDNKATDKEDYSEDPQLYFTWMIVQLNLMDCPQFRT